MPAQQASPKKAGRRARSRPVPAVLDETPRQGSASFCSKCSRLFEQADSNNTQCPSCTKRRVVRAKAAAKLDSQAPPRPTLDVHRSSANPAVHTDSDRSVKAAEKKTPGSVSRTPFQEDRDSEPQLALRMGMEDMLLDQSLLEGSVAAEADEPAFAMATASVLLHLRRENRTLRRRLAAQTHALFSAPRSKADVSLATDPEDALEPAGVRELRQRLNALLRQPPRSARAEEELWKVGEAVDAVSGGWGGSRRREARWRGLAMIEQSACAVVTQELHLVEQMLGSLHQALDWSGEQLAISRAEARELRQREQLCQVRAIAAEAARSDAQLQASHVHDAWAFAHTPRMHGGRTSSSSVSPPLLSRQVDVRHDAALKLQDEIRTLQSKQGFHHTELIEFVNSNHHRISEELRGRERRFRRLEKAVLAALAAAGHARPLPAGKPPRASLHVATPMHDMQDSPRGSEPTLEPISLHELAEAVGEGADQVRESLALLAAEVSRGDTVQRDGYERRLRQAEAELLRVTRTRTDFMAHAQKAAQQGTEHMLQRLAKQLEQLGAAQDESVARLAEQSRHEKARLGTMRSAFSDELEQACAWHVHAHTYTRSSFPCAPLSLCSAVYLPMLRCTRCSMRWRPSTVALSHCGLWTSLPRHVAKASTSRHASPRRRWRATTRACSPSAGRRGARSRGATAPHAPRVTRLTRRVKRARGSRRA